MRVLWHLCLFSLCTIVHSADQYDPCKTAFTLEKMEQRFKENHIHDRSLMLCDRYSLGNGRWVRADAQDLLQTEPKTHEWCGTRYPIWMKEPPPEFVGEEVERDACVVGLQDSCAETLPIKIKKCVHYNVYYLTPPTSCYKAYCFQYSVNGTPPTDVVERPVVGHQFVRVEDKTATQQLQFVCSFTAKQIDYYYQVRWYIDDEPLVMKDAVQNESIRNTNLGYDDKDKTKGYQKLGINIKCSVCLKEVPDGVPGPFSEISKNYFAGIQVTSTRVNIKRDKPEGHIEVKLTIPFGCPFMPNGMVENCGLDIEMNVPRDPEKCSSVIKSAETLISQGKNCGFRIFQTDWDKKVTLPIAFIDTPEYDLVLPDSPDGAFRIGMITGQKEGSPEWSGIELQDVYVHISHSADIWQGKECHAVNDPHMLTFDGRRYENQNPGRFVLYWGKREGFPMEVQIETTACNRGPGRPRWDPFCVCAVAVRAGADVFVIDRCPHKPIRIKYLSCNENLLDARKLDEKNYRIYFPSGTYVQAVLEDYPTDNVRTVNVHVYPSKSDHDRTGGLCGTLNGNMWDDFMDRDGNLLWSAEAFNQHWSLRKAEFLGNMNEDQLNALPRWKHDVFYCTCPYKQVSGNKPEDIGECSEDTIVKCAKEDNPALNKNNCQIRSKRSAVKPFSYKMFQRQDIQFSEFTDTDEINISRTKREAEVIWTREKASDFCNNFIKQSQTYKACSRVPSVSPDSLIENCVLDIMMTNSTIWAGGSREALRTTCMKELSQNTTLKEVIEEGKPSIAEQVKMITCTNECSGHGICINGTCKCDEDFGAKDCSMDLNKPPVVYGVNIEEGGLCDKRTCQRALVEGYGFLDMDTLKCLLTVFYVTENKTVVGDVMEYMVQAEHDSIAEVFCPLGPARRRRSVPRGFVQGITLSVANNGRNFSTHHTIYVLDGVCQDTVNVSGDIQFTLRVGYCYINRKCYGDGSIHETEECIACNTEKSTTEWSKVDGCGLVTEAVDDKLEINRNLKPEGDSFPTTIVVTVLVSVLVLAALVTSVVLYYKMKRSASFSLKSEAYKNMENRY